jgi:type IV pilus assembly protein PilW
MSLPERTCLVIRRTNTTLPIGPLVANEVYMQAKRGLDECGESVIALGSQAANFTLVRKDAVTARLFIPAEIRKYHVIHLLRQSCSEPVGGAVCTAAADGGRPIPTLKRFAACVRRHGAYDAHGIGRRRDRESAVDYGVDADGDGLPDGAFVAAPASVAAWSDVMGVQVFVLARTPERTTGIVDNKTYNLGTFGAVVAPGDL